MQVAQVSSIRPKFGPAFQTPAAGFSVATSAEKILLREADTQKSTEPAQLSAIYRLTEREGRELLSFILKHLDAEEKGVFEDDLQQAVAEALSSRSLFPIAHLLADWETTAEVKADSELSRKLHEAFEEADSFRGGRGA